MKFHYIAIIAALVAAPVLAQTPNGSVGENKSTSSGNTNNAKGEAKTGAAGGMNGKALTERQQQMDTNGDGMVSLTEYNAYHARMWKSYKPVKGMVKAAEIDAGGAGN